MYRGRKGVELEVVLNHSFAQPKEITMFSRDYTKCSVKIGPDTHTLTKLLCFEFNFIHAITTCHKERENCFISEVPVIHNCN